MPQVDTPLLLDILLGLVILLFVPFGLRRGVAKEVMVSAGILLGVTLAERFGQKWGEELSVRFALQPVAASFAVSVLLLFAGAFLLGYGGGAALGATRPGTASRLVGGLLAAFNAALLLSYLLRWIEDMLQQGGALDDGIVSAALLRQSDMLLLWAASVLMALIVVGWIVNALRSRRLPRESDRVLAGGIPARQRPVRVSREPDSGKYEPGSEHAGRSGRFGPGLDATSPLSPTSTIVGQQLWPTDEHPATGANGHGRAAFADRAPQLSASPEPVQNDETIWSAWTAPGNDEPFSRTETANKWPVAPSIGVTDDERCAVCRARVGQRDVFCPECGATL